MYRLTAASLAHMEAEAPDIDMAFNRFMAEFSSRRLLFTTHTLESLAD